jgi:hypothetical protein
MHVICVVRPTLDALSTITRSTMHHANHPHAGRKVRLWPGLRLEMCGQDAGAQLTPDEAMGLASSLLLETRETLHQARMNAQHPAAPCSGLVARATPDCTTLSLWHQGAELVATLTSAQSDQLAKTITSQNGHLQIVGGIHQFHIPAAS